MASDLKSRLGTPDCVASPPPRNSMEDADCSVTRKRPRLDSGDRAYRSMSADTLRASHASPEPEQSIVPPEGTIQQTNLPTTPESLHLPLKDGTPSKVTINVKDSLRFGSSETLDHAVAPTPHLGPQTASEGKSSPAPEPTPPSGASTGSSPPRSPEIEVAEVEDMDEDSGGTRWRPLVSGMEGGSLQENLLNQFPCLQKGITLRGTVLSIADAFARNPLHDGSILEKVANWFREFLGQTELQPIKWYDMYYDDRDFWDEIPTMVESLLKRDNKFDSDFLRPQHDDDRDVDNRSYIEAFLCAYGALTARMIHIDCQTLMESTEDPNTVPDLVSKRYLNVFNWIFPSNRAALWRLLCETYQYDCKPTIAAVVVSFCQKPSSAVPHLSSFVQLILERLQSLPSLQTFLTLPIFTVNRIVACCAEFQRPENVHVPALQPELLLLPSQALDFFQAADKILQRFIANQVSALNLDLSKFFVTELAMTLNHITCADERLANEMGLERLGYQMNSSLEDFPRMIEISWKFELLQKCIKAGRMEIRVQGVETMQQQLVEAHDRYIAHNRALYKNPVITFLSDFILENKLVEYIVGVESHPQLIQRSGNIIGFLIVTHRYSDAESDAIWRAISISQDSRAIDAILTMLSSIFNLSGYPILLYLCKKLDELSLRSLDSKMINYGKTLLFHLRNKWRHQVSGQAMDMAPYKLCIRLIRQAAADEGLPPYRKSEIQQFALLELRELMSWSSNETDRKIIFEECVRDISGRTEFATGSISAVNVLLEQDPSRDIRLLATESDFATLVIDEFAHTVGGDSAKFVDSKMREESVSVRLDLLQQVILYIPDTITSDAGQTLWTTMFAAKAINNYTRNRAWDTLVAAARQCQHRNSFLDRCINEFLPHLSPPFFTSGISPFLEEVIGYEDRLTPSQEAQNNQIIAVPGAELLWKIALVAPDNTVELRATQTLVKQYLDSPVIRYAPRGAIEATYVGLVERCIYELTAAASKLRAFSDGTASGEDEPMVFVASDNETRTETIRFTRSLLLLKEFLRVSRTHPRASPRLRLNPKLPSSPQDFSGEPLCIMYQSFSGNVASGIHRLQVGDLETCDDLVARLVQLTGFTGFAAFAGGQKLDLTSSGGSTLREKKLGEKGLLLIKRSRDTQLSQEVPMSQELSLSEVEVQKHFGKIYELLDMEDKLAKDVFEFLIAFPPHQSITSLVCSEDLSINEAFPVRQSYKILYSVYALRHCLENRSQNEDATQKLIRHGVQALIQTLTALDLAESSTTQLVDIRVAAEVVECLLKFMKVPVSPDIAATYFSDHAYFVDRVQELIITFVSFDTAESKALSRDSFATLLEASLRSRAIWESFKAHEKVPILLRDLLMESSTVEIRQGVADAIRGVCGARPESVQTADSQAISTGPNSAIKTSVADFVSFFWGIIETLIPQSTRCPKDSQQFFEIAVFLFKAVPQDSSNHSKLLGYYKVWGDLLLCHVHDEFVGRDCIDFIVLGLASLLNWCIQLMGSHRTPLGAGDFMEKLFHSQIFPQISKAENDTRIQARVPSLHSKTRQELYSVVLALCNDLEDYRKLLSLIREVLPQGEDSNAWSWGIAQILEDYHYEPNLNFERTKMIRSSSGYAGLKNLSNTCYLNSLFTQLFMNISFRKFILDANVADGDGTQKLLAETKKVFAFMQETWLKSVDPQGIADSCVTYDNSLIDVSIQMDVDEFFNLLFDRWEAQMLSVEAKHKFRKFYGGQLVQQIKSKECPHISERLEPFSAIQCDIRGKASLAESLNAYVEGEIMEGDNKYSCTSCGCYVDAVKRACLKDIPDNLIFHLKRFDYDVMTGVRSKLNDEFTFPEQIDMTPYNVEHLREKDSSNEPDSFRLVGVLVHSGTAESGHYYSYIRERPSNPSQDQNWIEYNDADVSRFDPRHIPDQCYGGWTDPAPMSALSQMRYTKAWNAYMLFYQRISAMDTERATHAPLEANVPVKDELPIELNNPIAVENEIWIRKFCLYDPAHAQFMKSTLEKLRILSNGTCSDHHEIEKEAIWLTLEHLDQILSKSKDCPDFDGLLQSLARVIGSCAECCTLALVWVAQHDLALRNLLVRNPIPRVRRDFATMIMKALQHIRKNNARLYGFDVEDADIEPYPDNGSWPETTGAFQSIVRRLVDLRPFLHLHARAWDDYFGLLGDLANFGPAEAYVLLREGMLAHCFEILIIEHNGAKQLRLSHQHYTFYLKALEKGRKFSMVKLLELMRILMDSIDLELSPDDIDLQPRTQMKGKSPLSRDEEIYLRFGSDLPRSRNLVFLDKIINADQNIPATKAIITMMVRAEPVVGLLGAIYRTILGGVNIDPATLAAPYLRAALIFCEYSPHQAEAKELVRAISREIDTIGHNGGKEHLDFFVQARRVRNACFPRTPHLFHRMVLQTVPYWAPPLLMYWEESVRMDTIQLLKGLVFDHDVNNMDNEQEAEEITRVAKQLCQHCVKRVRENIVQVQKQVDAKSIDGVVDVIRHCNDNYYRIAEIEEDQVLVEEAEAVLESLYTLTVSDVDDAVSEGWDNNSDVPTDSESEFLMISP